MRVRVSVTSYPVPGYLFLFLPYLIVLHSFIAFAPSDLANSDHHDAITWPHLLLPIGYEDTNSLSSGKPMDNPHVLCLMLFIPL